MTDRERIAEICSSEKYGDGSNIAWQDLTDYEKSLAYDKADQIIAILPELGYTRQPEPVLTLSEAELPDHWGGDMELSGQEGVAFEEGKYAQLVHDQKTIRR